MQLPVKPQLCGWQPAPVEGERLESEPGMAYEVKWDGYRIVAANTGDVVRLYTRGGTQVTSEYPELVASLFALPTDAVLDGEVVVLRNGWPSFLDLQNRMTLGATRRAADLRYVVYDVLEVAGADSTQHSYVERRKVVER